MRRRTQKRRAPYELIKRFFPTPDDVVGETSIMAWLVVSSRHYRGETTTIRQLAGITGRSLRGTHLLIKKLRHVGLITYDFGSNKTIRPADRFGLELVDEPPCLTRLKDELAPQCQPRGNFGPTPTPAQAA